MKRVLSIAVLVAASLLSGCYGYVRPVGYYSNGYNTPYYGGSYYSPPVVVQQYRYQRSFGPSSYRSHQYGGHHHHNHRK